MKPGKNIISIKLLFLSWFIYGALQMRLDVSESIINQTGKWAVLSNFFRSFSTFSIVGVVLFAGIYCLLVFLYKEETHSGTAPWVIVASLVLSLFVVFGMSFEKTDSWRLVFQLRNGQIIKALFIFSGYFLLFKILLGKAFRILDERQGRISGAEEFPEPLILRWYAKQLCNHTLLTIMITLAIIYIPLLAISYPGLMMGDSAGLIAQGYPEWNLIRPVYMQGRLLSDHVCYNAHHSVAHALLIHLMVETGRSVFGSITAGIFLYTLVQFCIVLFTLGYTAEFLRKRLGIGWKGLALFEIYFICNPIIQNYMFLITKDVIYGCFLLLFIVSLFRLLDHANDKKVYGVLTASALGMFFFRNDARYILCMVFLVIAIFIKQYRKRLLAGIVVIAGMSVLLSKVIFPCFSITPGSTREMLSVPFQQTARYVKEYGHEITEEERSAIAAVLDFDTLAKRYDPDISDDVKETFNEEATREDLKNYFKVWVSMLRKHPGVYIQATMNNYYMYFYPAEANIKVYGFEWSGEQYELLSDHMEATTHQRTGHVEAAKKIRGVYANLRNYYSQLPIIRIFTKSGFYFWSIMICLAYAIHSRNRRACLLLSVFVFSILICCLGPCNGDYGRYIFPFILCLPALIPMLKNWFEKHGCPDRS